MLLRRELWSLGLRYRIDDKTLPGRPDIVFKKARVAVFCDGDFWHGFKLAEREEKLRAGHNAPYWLAKIRGNVERDHRNAALLEADGWLVLRFWETDIKRDAGSLAARVSHAVATRLPPKKVLRAK